MPFKFDKAYRGFYIFLVLAIIARVLSDVALQRFEIHQGYLFAYRHLADSLWLYPPAVLLLEWSLAVLGAVAIAYGKVRAGAVLASFSFLMSLTQMFQNQKVLIFIVCATLALQPLRRVQRDSVWFLKWQLVLVYLFTALQKVFNDFGNGKTLAFLLQRFSTAPNENFLALMKVLAWGTIGVELLLPLILVKKPKLGIWLVTAFHLSMSMVMKDLWPFAFMMIGLSLLFAKSVERSDDLQRDPREGPARQDLNFLS